MAVKSADTSSCIIDIVVIALAVAVIIAECSQCNAIVGVIVAVIGVGIEVAVRSSKRKHY